jgi:predicted nuclease of restriction endonuclease-like RecB superfamily
MKGSNNPMFGKIAKHGKGQYYKGIYMRSSYEIIYAKWLDMLNYHWIYEATTFNLGNTTYTPDFYLPSAQTYIEIKGFWRDDAKKKFKLFQKLYPEINIQIRIKSDIELCKKELLKSEV